MALDLPTCASCGLAVFPPHLLCSRCGSAEWASTTVEAGTLERVTFVRRSLQRTASIGTPAIGLVRTDPGPRIVVRVRGDAQPGQDVRLDLVDGAVVASPLEAPPPTKEAPS
ncbi:MAG TPA: zinc ribbon domain-containing protein [Solirubrobacteraceae bacterium]|jgi:uncharacterized OB-fold protein|nr:zinc ribbon domain-containing protein [Solirubrobacteraceae bacterium]